MFQVQEIASEHPPHNLRLPQKHAFKGLKCMSTTTQALLTRYPCRRAPCPRSRRPTGVRSAGKEAGNRGRI